MPWASLIIRTRSLPRANLLATLGRILDSLGDYLVARQEILQDAMQALPVPSQKEMDELYREIYLLKKRIKALEKNRDGNGATANEKPD